MASLEENLAFVQATYAKYAATPGHPDYTAFADDIVWKSPGDAGAMPTGGERRGKKALEEWFAIARRDWTFTSFEPLEFFGQGDRIAVRSRISFRHNETGNTGQIEKTDLLTIRDLKVVHFHEFFDPTPAIACARGQVAVSEATG